MLKPLEVKSVVFGRQDQPIQFEGMIRTSQVHQPTCYCGRNSWRLGNLTRLGLNNSFRIMKRDSHLSPSIAAWNCSAMTKAKVGPTFEVERNVDSWQSCSKWESDRSMLFNLVSWFLKMRKPTNPPSTGSSASPPVNASMVCAPSASVFALIPCKTGNKFYYVHVQCCRGSENANRL